MKKIIYITIFLLFFIIKANADDPQCQNADCPNTPWICPPPCIGLLINQTCTLTVYIDYCYRICNGSYEFQITKLVLLPAGGQCNNYCNLTDEQVFTQCIAWIVFAHCPLGNMNLCDTYTITHRFPRCWYSVKTKTYKEYRYCIPVQACCVQTYTVTSADCIHRIISQVEDNSDEQFDCSTLGQFCFDICSFHPIVDDHSPIIFSEANESQINSQLNGIKVYPNPGNDFLNLEFNSEKSNILSIRIVNSLGEISLSKEFVNTGNDKTKLDIRDLSEGVYYYYLSDGDKNYHGSFIIMR